MNTSVGLNSRVTAKFRALSVQFMWMIWRLLGF